MDLVPRKYLNPLGRLKTLIPFSHLLLVGPGYGKLKYLGFSVSVSDFEHEYGRGNEGGKCLGMPQLEEEEEGR
jgi:hypothetical protein